MLLEAAGVARRLDSAREGINREQGKYREIKKKVQKERRKTHYLRWTVLTNVLETFCWKKKINSMVSSLDHLPFLSAECKSHVQVFAL